MNRNQLKIIACISMLVDHMGYVLSPEIEIFRIIGRLAMPIFAFFIGEGCLYTKNRMKYFLRVFLLGIICQAVYIIESLITKSGSGFYLNILITFSLSIILCSAFLHFRENCKNGGKKFISIAVLVVTLLSLLALEGFCQNSKDIIGTEITIDYGIFGIILPLCASASKNKAHKLFCFSLGLLIFGLYFYGPGIKLLCALFSLLLLFSYNGKSGKANLKYFFYAFYPCHLALIYLIGLLIH